MTNPSVASVKTESVCSSAKLFCLWDHSHWASWIKLMLGGKKMTITIAAGDTIFSVGQERRDKFPVCLGLDAESSKCPIWLWSS